MLGPRADGGYYLVGLNCVNDYLQGIRWSCSDVLAQKIQKLADLGLKHELLSEWYDIDTGKDLERLQS